MSLSVDVKLAAPYIKAPQCVPLHQTLIKIGHPQLPIQIKVCNSTTVGVVKNIIEQNAQCSQTITPTGSNVDRSNISSHTYGHLAHQTMVITTPNLTHQATTQDKDPFNPAMLMKFHLCSKNIYFILLYIEMKWCVDPCVDSYLISTHDQ